MCGLKLFVRSAIVLLQKSHPSWVCGLKQPILNKRKKAAQVTPFVGVWIETAGIGYGAAAKASHPSWVCGLKLSNPDFAEAVRSHTLRGCVD